MFNQINIYMYINNIPFVIYIKIQLFKKFKINLKI